MKDLTYWNRQWQPGLMMYELKSEYMKGTHDTVVKPFGLEEGVVVRLMTTQSFFEQHPELLAGNGLRKPDGEMIYVERYLRVFITPSGEMGINQTFEPHNPLFLIEAFIELAQIVDDWREVSKGPEPPPSGIPKAYPTEYPGD